MASSFDGQKHTKRFLSSVKTEALKIRYHHHGSNEDFRSLIPTRARSYKATSLALFPGPAQGVNWRYGWKYLNTRTDGKVDTGVSHSLTFLPSGTTHFYSC